MNERPYLAEVVLTFDSYHNYIKTLTFLVGDPNLNYCKAAVVPHIQVITKQLNINAKFHANITYTKADDIRENEEKIFIRKNRECSEIIEVQQ